MPTKNDDIQQIVSALSTVRAWDRLYALLKNLPTSVLSNVADRIAALLKQTRDELLAARYEHYLQLLRQCCKYGVQAAMNGFEMPLDLTEKEVEAAVEYLFENYEDVSNVTQKLMFHPRWWNDMVVSSDLREVRALFEQKQDLLLCGVLERHLWLQAEDFHEETAIDRETSMRLEEYYRECAYFVQKARQVGIDKAWREYIRLIMNRDWTWIELFEIFEEWAEESRFGEEEARGKPCWDSMLYKAYRKGIQFIEAHQALLNPHFFEAPLTAEIMNVEQHISSFERIYKESREGPPAFAIPPPPEPEIVPLPAPVYQNSRKRMFGLIEGQSLLRDIYRRGGDAQAVQDAYINAYGGFVLEPPSWIEDSLQQLHLLQQAEENQETKIREYEKLLADTYLRATQKDPTVPPLIRIEISCRLLKDFEKKPQSKTKEGQEAQIGLYVSCLTDTYERYPYQWALIQNELGEIYQRRVSGDLSSNTDTAIQCYERALQVITRNGPYKFCDLTDSNRNWAVIQTCLGDLYTRRLDLGTSRDRQNDIDLAAKAYQAAHLIFTPETSLEIHRDLLLSLAFLDSQYRVIEAEQHGDARGTLEALRLADQAYRDAREANLELSWREYYLQERVQQIVTWSGVRTLYASHAWCLWRSGQVQNAVLALEEGRAHALTQSLAISDIESKGLCKDHARMLSEVRSNWYQQLARGGPDDIRAARQDLLALREAIRDHCQQDFLPRVSTYQSILESADPHQALVYITATEHGGLAFVIPPSKGRKRAEERDPLAIVLPKLTEQRISDWLIRTDEQRRIVGGYRYAVQPGGAAKLLGLWVLYPAGDEQERERRLATPIRDLPKAISAPFTTLQAAVKSIVEAQQRKAADLSMSLQVALEDDKYFTTTLNQFLLEAELELLQQELSDTFIVNFRQELDRLGLGDSDQPIALIPCSHLGMLPLHAAWARRDHLTGVAIPFAETCELTYQASARSLAIARKALKALPPQGPIIAIGNPLPTKSSPLEWATAEAETIERLALRSRRRGSRAIVEHAATRQEIEATLQQLQEGESPSGAWIHIASHGYADPTDPKNCYMLLSNNEELKLADLQKKQIFSGVRGFIASGCMTALGDLERAPDELISLAAGALQAGAPCALATFWTVSDLANYLLMVHFMGELLQNTSSTPARALRESAKWLKMLTYEQLLVLEQKGLEGFRLVSQDLARTPDVLRGVMHADEKMAFVSDDHSRFSMEQALSALKYVGNVSGRAPTSHPFAHARHWASTIIYGA